MGYQRSQDVEARHHCLWKSRLLFSIPKMESEWA